MIGQLALPEYQHIPAKPTERPQIPRVPPAIRVEFWFPEVQTRLGHSITESATVSMPEAAVNENHLSTRREHEIGRSGQSSVVQPIAVAHAVDQSAHGHLRLGVLAAHQGHP